MIKPKQKQKKIQKHEFWIIYSLNFDFFGYLSKQYGNSVSALMGICLNLQLNNTYKSLEIFFFFK